MVNPLWDYFSINVQFFKSCVVILCNIFNNICEIIGTILTLLPMNIHVNQFSATYKHKLHYKTKD
jgi:hypothetical protein